MSDKIDNGGPAFPCEGGDMSGLMAHYGMSLRDYFAAAALANSHICDGSLDKNAEWAYTPADAMIAARGRKS